MSSYHDFCDDIRLSHVKAESAQWLHDADREIIRDMVMVVERMTTDERIRDMAYQIREALDK